MRSPQNISIPFLRRVTLLALTTCHVLTWSSGAVEAGVILSWADESPLAILDSVDAGWGASSPSDSATGGDSAPAGHEGTSDRETFVAGLLGAGGGASAPTDSASGQTSSQFAVTSHLSSVKPYQASLLRQHRERSLQLPQPPRGELLDPPKADAERLDRFTPVSRSALAFSF